MDDEEKIERNFLRRMAAIVTLGFFGCLFLLFYQGTNLNPTEQNLLSMLIGMLASKWQTIIDYLFKVKL